MMLGAKAMIMEKWMPASAVPFQFNPETISFTKTSQWRETPTQSGEDAPQKQFRGAGGINLSLKMVLDDSFSMAGTVEPRVNLLLSWTNPESSDNAEPKTLIFCWGRFSVGFSKAFECHLKSLNVEYTLFDRDGHALRANCSVQLAGTGSVRLGQNPTSGSRQPVKSAVVRPDESLPLLTHRHLGTSNQWRDVAQFNSVDNPFRVRPGTSVILPHKPQSTKKR